MNKIMSDIKCYFYKIKHPILIVLITGLTIRFALIPFTFNPDPQYWATFMEIINGNNSLYDTAGYTYTPIWGYFLSSLAFISSLFGITHYASIIPTFIPYLNTDPLFLDFITTIEFNTMLKISLIVVDIIVAVLIYQLVDDTLNNKIKAAMAAALWFLCPITIIDSSIHGMFDNISAMFIVLTFIFLYKRKYTTAGFVFAFSVFTKYFPIFFIFMLLAILFSKEGYDKNGVNKLLYSIVGFVAGFVLIYLPVMITGTFWDSMSFITRRLNIDTDTLNTVLPPWMLLVILIVLLILVTLFIHFFKDKITDRILSFKNMDPKNRDRIVIITCLIAIGILLLAALVCFIYAIATNDLDGFAMRWVLFITIASIIIQMFIAYRYIFNTDHSLKPTVTALMLTSCVMFLWQPLPWYLVVIIPFLVVYLIIADRNFIKPFILFSTITMLHELAMFNTTAFYSLASFTSFITNETLISMIDYVYISSPVFSAIKSILGPLAYISLIYMIYYWLKKNRWGKLHEQ